MVELLTAQDISALLTQGADERIALNKEGLTKYGMAIVDDEIQNRGSCTCNPATNEDLELMLDLLTTHSSKAEWIELRDQISEELKRTINQKDKDNFEVFFAPSGTDLLYYPLIFSQLLYPEQKMLNIVTCFEELGSGTGLASAGKFYANFNQYGKPIAKGAPIIKDKPIKTVFLKARSEEGKILDNEAQIEQILQKHPEHLTIINLVYGSKSGIEDKLSLIDKIKGDNIIWNTDLCQFRHSNDIINYLLEKNAMVMITGSKFYQSPPFSGAILVPKALFKQVNQSHHWASINPYACIFSKFDFPKALRPLLDFPSRPNIPLLLRWSTALAEIKKYKKLPPKLVDQKIKLWRKTVVKEMKKRVEFELMPHQEGTNQTILSFRLKVGNTYMNHDDLKKIHQTIVTDNYSNQYDFERIFIGQPVSYTHRSFLRLAIGAKDIRHFIAKDEKDFKLDYSILDIIQEKLYRYYENNY